MTVAQAIRAAAALLSSLGLADARLEAEVLLMHLLQVDRARLYASVQQELLPEVQTSYQRLVQRRMAREPLAYIVGHREFFGLDLYVDRRVMIPRQETETLVEAALGVAGSIFKDQLPTIADVGTGSGAIAIALALRLPSARIYATDTSLEALDVARLNCARSGVLDRVTLLHGDLLSPLPEPVDLIVANLPYIPDDEWERLAPEIRQFEPPLALRGGPDGLEPVSRLVGQVPQKLKPRGVVLLEIGHGQGRAALDIIRTRLPEAAVHLQHDLAGLERVAVVSLGTGDVGVERCGIIHGVTL